MKQIIISLVLILIMIFSINSCTDPERKDAIAKLEYAKKLARDSEFENAKLTLDSIELNYPNQFAVLNEARTLNDMISLSIYKARHSKLKLELESVIINDEVLKNNFNYIPGAYNQPGKYEHKRQTPANSHQRAYLKVHLYDNGEFYLSSNYYGNTWLSHIYVRVYDKDLLAESEKVPLSDPDNIKFEEGENLWEQVSYRNDRDKDIVDFIIQYSERRLKVRFSGKKHHYIVMETFDKQAVKEGYEFALAFKRRHDIKTEIKELEDLIRLVKK